MANLPTYEEIAKMTKELAEKALDEYVYKDKTLREWINIIDNFHLVIDEATKAIEQTRWISVSERLPEKNMACLVSVGDFNLTQIAMYSDCMKAVKHKIFYQGDVGCDNFKNITEYVKAWMPLPEPYRAEGETEQVLSYADQDTLMSAT